MPNYLSEEAFKQRCKELGVELGENRYTIKLVKTVCGECGRTYDKNVPFPKFPCLIGRCHICGAPIIQRSVESKSEDTCECSRR